MLIQLKTEVAVTLDNSSTYVIPKGARVNYSLRHVGQDRFHVIQVYVVREVVTYAEKMVTDAPPPAWL